MTLLWNFFGKQILIKKTFKGRYQITSLSKVSKGNQKHARYTSTPQRHKVLQIWPSQSFSSAETLRYCTHCLLRHKKFHFFNVGKSTHSPRENSKPKHTWHNLQTLHFHIPKSPNLHRHLAYIKLHHKYLLKFTPRYLLKNDSSDIGISQPLFGIFPSNVDIHSQDFSPSKVRYSSRCSESSWNCFVSSQVFPKRVRYSSRC